MSTNPERYDGGAAFPVGVMSMRSGMSLRDYFAAQLAASIHATAAREQFVDEALIAKEAYTIAEALIAERAQLLGKLVDELSAVALIGELLAGLKRTREALINLQTDRNALPPIGFFDDLALLIQKAEARAVAT